MSQPPSAPTPPQTRTRRRNAIIELIRAGGGQTPATHPRALSSGLTPDLPQPHAPPHTATLPPVLDAHTYPHLVDALLLLLDRPTLRTLRGVHPSLRDHIDTVTLVSATLTPTGFLRTHLGITLPLGLADLTPAQASRIRRLRTCALTHWKPSPSTHPPPRLRPQLLECEEDGVAVPAPFTITTTRLFGATHPSADELHIPGFLPFEPPPVFGSYQPGAFHDYGWAGLNPAIDTEDLTWVIEYKDNADWEVASLCGRHSFFQVNTVPFFSPLSLHVGANVPAHIKGGWPFAFPPATKRVKLVARCVEAPGGSYPINRFGSGPPFITALARAIAQNLDNVEFTVVGEWKAEWVPGYVLLMHEGLTFAEVFAAFVARQRAHMGKADGVRYVFRGPLRGLSFEEGDGDRAARALREIVPAEWV